MGMTFAATKKRHTRHSTKARTPKPATRTKSKTSKRTRNTRTHSSYQATPSPERYQEIQQALSAKGYFKGEANGEWGSDSVDALRRFQTDQKLEPDGKLGSLSLIALGLGPKRITAQARPEPATQSKP